MGEGGGGTDLPGGVSRTGSEAGSGLNLKNEFPQSPPTDFIGMPVSGRPAGQPFGSDTSPSDISWEIDAAPVVRIADYSSN